LLEPFSLLIILSFGCCPSLASHAPGQAVLPLVPPFGLPLGPACPLAPAPSRTRTGWQVPGQAGT